MWSRLRISWIKHSRIRTGWPWWTVRAPLAWRQSGASSASPALWSRSGMVLSNNVILYTVRHENWNVKFKLKYLIIIFIRCPHLVTPGILGLPTSRSPMSWLNVAPLLPGPWSRPWAPISLLNVAGSGPPGGGGLIAGNDGEWSNWVYNCHKGVKLRKYRTCYPCVDSASGSSSEFPLRLVRHVTQEGGP